MKRKILIVPARVGLSASAPPPRSSEAASSTTRRITERACSATSNFSSNSFSCRRPTTQIAAQLQPRAADGATSKTCPRATARSSPSGEMSPRRTPTATPDRGSPASTPGSSNINTGYQQGDDPTPPIRPGRSARQWIAIELARVQSQYASVELADGANMNAMATIGSIRGNARQHSDADRNLEQDSFSDDPISIPKSPS